MGNSLLKTIKIKRLVDGGFPVTLIRLLILALNPGFLPHTRSEGSLIIILLKIRSNQS